MMILLLIFGAFFLWGVASPQVRGKVLGGAMAGTALGCLYFMFLVFVILFSIPLFLAMIANPKLIVLGAIGVPLFIFVLAIVEAAIKG